MSVKKVFVTVGTTKFEKLVEEVSKDELLNILYSLGYKFIQFQVGIGKYTKQDHPRMKVEYYRYFEHFLEEIDSSHLIISHAGAGTCLEVLKKQKPLIVVINDDLMNNHQIELAQQLAKEGYLHCCTVSNLKNILMQNNFRHCKPYPQPNEELFSNYLNKCMGFET